MWLLWLQQMTYQVRVSVVNSNSLCFIWVVYWWCRTASQWNMPLQMGHLVLGFLITSSLRTILSFVFENTAAGGRFVSECLWVVGATGWPSILFISHTHKHCSETSNCSCCSWSLSPLAWGHCLEKTILCPVLAVRGYMAAVVSEAVLITSLKPFHISFLKLI